MHAQWCPVLAVPKSFRRELVANMKTSIAIRAGHSLLVMALRCPRRSRIERDASTLARMSGRAKLRRTDGDQTKRRTIMDATVQSPRQQPTRATCVSSSGSMLRNWKLRLVFAAVAVAAGAAFNWSWLLAAGAAPLLLSVLPCLAMCALHLCANKSAGGSCADLQGPIPAPRDDVNAAKSADMSERSEV